MQTLAKYKLAGLALACSTLLYSTNALADADLNGRITDSSQRVLFDGALVEIEALNLKTVSARDGSFRFRQLPEGEHRVKITYLGVAPVEQTIVIRGAQVVNQDFILGSTSSQDAAIEEVVVFGQRANQAAALNRQKNANRITSVVSADAIGQFPDQNVAEALQRLPGMFIQRDQGEGRFVGIRGIDPNLNNLTINGVNVPSPESGVRSVAMDVIPSELVASLEVSKSVTPDMDADAIGGSIEVKSLSAFDRADDAFSLNAQLTHTELREETSPKLSGSYSTIFELDGGNRLGIAAALSWAQRKFGSDNIETDGGWGDMEVENNASGEDVEIFGAEEIEQRAYWIERERTGLALNFDYQTQHSDLYLRTLYSKFSDDEFRLRNEYKFSDGKLLSGDAHHANFTGAEMDRDSKDRFEEQKIQSFVLGGQTRMQAWIFDYNMGYSKSSEAEPDRIDADFAAKDIDMSYVAGEKPTLSQSANGQDLSKFELDELVFENNYTEDKEFSLKLDITREFVWNNHNGEFKFGAKMRNRDKRNDLMAMVYDGGFNEATGANFATDQVNWDLGNFGPGINRSAIRDFYNANRANFELNRLDSDMDSKGGSFTSSEDIIAAYAMVSVNIDNWHIVTGLRFESTDFSTRGNRVEVIKDEVNDIEKVQVNPWEVDKSYDHILPNLNVRYDFSDQLVGRFAYTQTLARPKFGDSAAFQIIESETEEKDGKAVTERKAEVGNPDLDPYESDNLDLAIEYYPGNIGVLSAGIFYKDISNFIVPAEVQDNGKWDGFEEVVQPINGGDASISGVELAWSKTFDSGLLFIANATFTDSDDLPNQSDTVGNIAVGYEDDKFSARLTLTHKSKAYQFDDQKAPVYEDAHNQIDLNVKYYITDQINVYFNGVNLNDEPFYLYHRSRAYNYQYETYGRSFEIGVSWNAF